MSGPPPGHDHRGLAIISVLEAVQAAAFLSIAAHVDDLPGSLHRVWILAEVGAGLAAMTVGLVSLLRGFWSSPARPARGRRTSRRTGLLVLAVVVGVVAEVVAAIGPVADDDVAVIASGMEAYLLIELAWQYRSLATRVVGFGTLAITVAAVGARLGLGTEPGAVVGPALGVLLLVSAAVTLTLSIRAARS